MILPVMVWVCVGIIPLLVVWADLPIWAKPEKPIEKYALPMMVSILTACSSMLFPWLLANLRTATMVSAIVIVQIQLAGLLGGESGLKILFAIVAIWIWLTSLAIWRQLLRTQITQLAGVAVVASTSFGTAVATYLRLEFAHEEANILQNALMGLIALSASAILAFLFQQWKWRQKS